MGKRSNFAKIDKDAYQTIDHRAVLPLIPHLEGISLFAEPCVGSGLLVQHLKTFAPQISCGYENDIERGEDAVSGNSLERARNRYDSIITNPPWSRPILHAMIERFQSIAPTWLLFDSDWMFTRQSERFMTSCHSIIAVGRLKWMPDTTMSGKDNCAWYGFDARHTDGPKFFGRKKG